MLSIRFNKFFRYHLLHTYIIQHEQAFRILLAQEVPKQTKPADPLAPS